MPGYREWQFAIFWMATIHAEVLVPVCGLSKHKIVDDRTACAPYGSAQ